MPSFDNMSDSEDGQLRSPNDNEQYISDDDDDTDSLDIKPPQARLSNARDLSSGSRRKEKKHSKEHKQQNKERHSGSGRLEREAHHRNSRGGGESGSDREHRTRNSDGGNISSDPRRDYRRDERHELEQQQQQRYHHRHERELLTSNEQRRYPKHSGGGGGHPSYHYQSTHHHHQPPPPPVPHQGYGHHHHHHQPLPPPLHMPPRPPRHDYYHGSDYHHGNSRHHGVAQMYDKHMTGEYTSGGGSGGGDVEMVRDTRRYKYSAYDQPKDAESLEQDLRSRLLSKRHKYVKGYEVDEHHYERTRDVERKERGIRGSEEYERERAAAKAERHKMRREKERAAAAAAAGGGVIEVLDSPDNHHHQQHRRKRKQHSREHAEYVNEEEPPLPRRKTPDDPELLARRAKLLAAEREKEKRKEIARGELEARREMLRERNNDQSDALSPSAVAASVTAGLNVVTKRKSDTKLELRKDTKRTKKLNQNSEKDDEDSDKDSISDSHSDEEESEDNDASNSEDSVAESEDSYGGGGGGGGKNVEKKKKRKKTKEENIVKADVDDDDDDVPLPDSPHSIFDLYKSPKKKNKKKMASSRSHSSGSTHSSKHSSSRSRSRSRSRGGRSHSRSNSRSSSEHSRSRSTSSGSRSEERGMDEEEDDLSDKEEGIGVIADAIKAASSLSSIGTENDALLGANEKKEPAAPCNEKGELLPNYFPGIQGCRSVEEFQCLNRIEEGTYGVVYRAKDKRTNEIVALKRLKMEKEKEGFPITSLREINTLLKGQHPNIVTVREIVVGSNMDKIFIVMDYVEHDLKSLMETMKQRKQSFFPGEVKCLTQQLLCAVAHLHDNWILHRDLKTSNLLLSHKGILKVGDFGLAREYGSPLKKYTSLVVTLWYRAPELLLCAPEYSTPIDIWSVGCIFAEFLQMAPLLPGKSEVDQLNRIYKELGTPSEKIWTGYNELPAVKNMISQNSQFAEYPVSQLRKHFLDKSTELGIALLQGLLTYDPKQRLTADAALKHAYLKELPLPIDPSMFPTWPAKSELNARKVNSPKAPPGGGHYKQLGNAGNDPSGAGNRNASGNAGGGTQQHSSSASGNKLTSGIITGNKKTASNTGFVLNSGLSQRQLAMGPGFSLKF